MDYRFKAEEWALLTAAERARRCRLMAEEATTLAKSAPPKMKQSYLSIANDWTKLAAEIEQAEESRTPPTV
jgi:hypothetical protein